MSTITSKAITLLIVDDSELVRAGLKSLLSDTGHSKVFEIVGEAHSVATAISQNARLKPDVVLLDIRLPDGSGFEACREIRARQPDTRVLILTAAIDDDLIYEAMSSGAHGYLLKEINTPALIQAITDVAAGKFILDPVVTTRVLALMRNGAPPNEPGKLAQLSGQERRVLALVAEGKTNKEIAEQMTLSDKTVKNYLSNVFEKLQINRRSQAAVLYTEGRKTSPPIRP